MRGINTNVFDEIHRWVCESFNTIKSFGTPGIAEATRAFTIVTDASSKLLFAGLVLTSKFSSISMLRVNVWLQKMVVHIKLILVVFSAVGCI